MSEPNELLLEDERDLCDERRRCRNEIRPYRVSGLVQLKLGRPAYYRNPCEPGRRSTDSRTHRSRRERRAIPDHFPLDPPLTPPRYAAWRRRPIWLCASAPVGCVLRPKHPVRRAPYRRRATIQDVGVDHCGAYVSMAEELLDRPDVVAVLQEVRRE